MNLILLIQLQGNEVEINNFSYQIDFWVIYW